MPDINVFRQEATALNRRLDYLAEQMTRIDGEMINPQEFGQLKAEVAAQRRDLDRIAGSIEKLATAVEGVQVTMNEARGGWRAIAFVAGIGAMLGGFVAWALQHVQLR